jgi:hypothetical protein
MHHQLQRLQDRLDVIETVLSIALTEPEPDHRGRMLCALSAAAEVARTEQRTAETIERKRSTLRLVHSADPVPTAVDVPAARSPYRIPDHANLSAG